MKCKYMGVILKVTSQEETYLSGRDAYILSELYTLKFSCIYSYSPVVNIVFNCIRHHFKTKLQQYAINIEIVPKRVVAY